jgi:hypothetical protein
MPCDSGRVAVRLYVQFLLVNSAVTGRTTFLPGFSRRFSGSCSDARSASSSRGLVGEDRGHRCPAPLREARHSRFCIAIYDIPLETPPGWDANRPCSSRRAVAQFAPNRSAVFRLPGQPAGCCWPIKRQSWWTERASAVRDGGRRKHWRARSARNAQRGPRPKRVRAFAAVTADAAVLAT